MRALLAAVAVALLPVTLAAPAPPGTASLSDDIIAAGAPLVQAFAELDKVTGEILWEEDEYHYPTKSCHGSNWSSTVYCLNATAPTVFARVDRVVSALHQTINAIAPLAAQVDTTTPNNEYLKLLRALIPDPTSRPYNVKFYASVINATADEVYAAWAKIETAWIASIHQLEAQTHAELLQDWELAYKIMDPAYEFRTRGYEQLSALAASVRTPQLYVCGAGSCAGVLDKWPVGTCNSVAYLPFNVTHIGWRQVGSFPWLCRTYTDSACKTPFPSPPPAARALPQHELTSLLSSHAKRARTTYFTQPIVEACTWMRPPEECYGPLDYSRFGSGTWPELRDLPVPLGSFTCEWA